MKRFLAGIITAAMLWASVPGMAAETATSDEVKAMVFATGITEEPLLDKKIINIGNALDSRTIREIIGDGGCFKICQVPVYDGGRLNLDNGNFVEFDNYKGNVKSLLDLRIGGEGWDYEVVNPNTDTDYAYIDLRHDANCRFMTSESVDDQNPMLHDFEKISEIINRANVGKPKDMRIVMESGAGVVYFETEQGEYVFSDKKIETPMSDYVGSGLQAMQAETVIPAAEFVKFVLQRDKDNEDAYALYQKRMNERLQTVNDDGFFVETVPYDEHPEYYQYQKTDTRAVFEGTPKQFSDIPDSARLLNACVNELVSMNVISGYNDGTFRGEATITRAEAAAMIRRLMRIELNVTDKFSDVDNTAWYAGDVGAVVNAGFMGGYDDGTFKPEQEITYNEVFAALCTLRGAPGTGMKGALIWAQFNHITDELASFTADAPITRGDMAILLSRLLDFPIATYQTSLQGIDAYTEMTLIDYLNGKQPVFRFINSKPEYEAYVAAYENEVNKRFGDIIDSYYKDARVYVIEGTPYESFE